MRAVMISIQPQWVEKILNGKKTIEIRKTRPNINEPFKCFIYCTKAKPEIAQFKIDNKWAVREFNDNTYYANGCTGNIGDTLNGKVVGEFICDKIVEIKHNKEFGNYFIEDDEYTTNQIAEQSCLTFNNLDKYLNGKTGYAWHISDLKIYDKPKEIKEFKQVKTIRKYHKQGESKIETLTHADRVEIKHLERPFQSWGYVEEEE